MSPPSKMDPARGWMFVEKLLAEDEAERIEGLSDDEFVAELKDKGVDSSHARSVEDLLERAKARAAAQARAAVPQNAAAPVMPEHARAKAEPSETPAPVPPKAPVVPLRRRPPRFVWFAAAASIAAVVGVAALSGPEIVSSFKPSTPREKAEGLRDDAIGNCARAAWGPCRQLLDDAARIDPAGESEERVQKAREAIAKATHPGPGTPDTPGPDHQRPQGAPP